MTLPPVPVILLAVVIVACACLLALWLLWRRRTSKRSRFGFKIGSSRTASRRKDGNAESVPSATEAFVNRHGQRIADVLVDYAKAKGLRTGSVYSAWLQPEGCVWWVGEKFPSSPKDVIAAVHAGVRPLRGFRSKVMVLKDAAEVDALAKALGRAAKVKMPPIRHDAWNMPIAFEGFPLRPVDGEAIVDLMEQDVPAKG